MGAFVTALSTTPVKGTQIQSVDEITVNKRGAIGDRAFYIVDADAVLFNGKRTGLLHTVVADYDPATRRLGLSFADGERVEGRVRMGASIDTQFFSRQYRVPLVEGPWSEALSRHLGVDVRLVKAQIGVDRGAEGSTSLVSVGSLRRLAATRAVGDGDGDADSDGGLEARAVDGRRFRMLIEFDGVDAHAEDGWVGRDVCVGETRLRIHGHIGRCVTTTRSPLTGEVNFPTLKMLASYRLRDMQTTERLPFGVHAEVLVGGMVRVGDAVRVEDRAAADDDRAGPRGEPGAEERRRGAVPAIAHRA